MFPVFVALLVPGVGGVGAFLLGRAFVRQGLAEGVLRGCFVGRGLVGVGPGIVEVLLSVEVGPKRGLAIRYDSSRPQLRLLLDRKPLPSLLVHILVLFTTNPIALVEHVLLLSPKGRLVEGPVPRVLVYLRLLEVACVEGVVEVACGLGREVHLFVAVGEGAVLGVQVGLRVLQGRRVGRQGVVRVLLGGGGFQGGVVGLRGDGRLINLFVRELELGVRLVGLQMLSLA